MSEQLRILIIDDHSLFRESLSRLLESEPDLRVVGSCATATEALQFVETDSVDVALLDYDLGEEQGWLFMEQGRRKGFRGRILIVTAGMSDAETLRALERDCAGIFLKHSPPAQLVQAIHSIMSGEVWLDPRCAKALVAGVTGRSEQHRAFQPLTDRERTVLRAVFEGLTNKEIATELGTSENAIKWVMQQLFQKTACGPEASSSALRSSATGWKRKRRVDSSDFVASVSMNTPYDAARKRGPSPASLMEQTGELQHVNDHEQQHHNQVRPQTEQ